MIALVHEGKTFSVLKRQLMVNCDIFEDDAALLMRPYRVKSQVSAAKRDKLVRTCSKFRDCRSLLTQPYNVTSLIGADVFRAFVNAIDGVSPNLTNENITDIGLLCDEFGYEQLSATVAKFLALHSSPGERACREIVAVKAQIAALEDEITNIKAENLRQG
jgi:hypothetical protein